jgi:hypothetical protein
MEQPKELGEWDAEFDDGRTLGKAPNSNIQAPDKLQASSFNSQSQS